MPLASPTPKLPVARPSSVASIDVPNLLSPVVLPLGNGEDGNPVNLTFFANFLRPQETELQAMQDRHYTEVEKGIARFRAMDEAALAQAMSEKPVEGADTAQVQRYEHLKMILDTLQGELLHILLMPELQLARGSEDPQTDEDRTLEAQRQAAIANAGMERINDALAELEKTPGPTAEEIDAANERTTARNKELAAIDLQLVAGRIELMAPYYQMGDGSKTKTTVDFLSQFDTGFLVHVFEQLVNARNGFLKR